MTGFDARAALKARDDMKHEDYLLSELVLATLSTKRWWTIAGLRDNVGAFYRGVTAEEVERVVRVYQDIGTVVSRRVKGRKERFSTLWAFRKAHPRGSLRGTLAEANERRRLFLAEARVRAAEIREEQRKRWSAAGSANP